MLLPSARQRWSAENLSTFNPLDGPGLSARQAADAKASLGVPEVTEGGEDDLLRPAGSVILMSSISGIAGAFGQVNYSFSKAALLE